MKTIENGIDKLLCDELIFWASSYFYGKDLHPSGWPNPVKTETNFSWHPSIVKDSRPVIIYEVNTALKEKIKKNLFEKNLISDVLKNLSPMVYVWTPGSYIPLHTDGGLDQDRQGFTAYLNKEWSVEYGGLFNYLSKKDNIWKTLLPHQGFLVYNDENEAHFTTPVHEGNIRFSLQIFIDKN
jgi:hypothetical protein